jgi:hypothetical protein
MKQFYETYCQNEKVSSLLTQNHADIGSNFKDTYIMVVMNYTKFDGLKLETFYTDTCKWRMGK